MSFPVTVNGVVYSLADFSPMGYLTALPNSIESMGRQMLRGFAGSSTASINLSAPANLTNINIGTDLAFNVGDIVCFYRNSTNYVHYSVTAYSPITGVFSGSYVSQQPKAGSGTFAVWTVSYVPSDLSIAYQGSSKSLGAEVLLQSVVPTVDLLRQNSFVEIGGPSAFMKELNEDFFSHSSYAVNNANPVSGGLQPVRAFQGMYTSSNYAVVISNNYAENGSAHPGVVSLPVANGGKTGERVCLSHGQGGYICALGSGSTRFSAGVKVSAASSSIDTFYCYVGLRGQGSSVYGNIFDAYGLGFRYTDSENSGYWQIEATHRGVRTTIPTTILATSWASLHIKINANTKTAYFYGTNTAGVDPESQTPLASVVLGDDFIAALPQTLLHPAASIHKTVGSTTRYLQVDYLNCSKALWRD